MTVLPSPYSSGRDRTPPAAAHRHVTCDARGGETASHAWVSTANVTRPTCHLLALRDRRDIHVA